MLKRLLIAISFLMVSSSAYAQAEQEWFEAGLFVYDSDGVAVELITAMCHVVTNKKRLNATCHGYSENAAELFATAQLYDSFCGLGPFDAEMVHMNVATPSGQVIFKCHKELD